LIGFSATVLAAIGAIGLRFVDPAPVLHNSFGFGQNIAASSSRAKGRPSAATSATMASALRVSTTIGHPATATSSGPWSRIDSGSTWRGIA
jgi:hypothetical protein